MKSRRPKPPLQSLRTRSWPRLSTRPGPIRRRLIWLKSGDRSSQRPTSILRWMRLTSRMRLTAKVRISLQVVVNISWHLSTQCALHLSACSCIRKHSNAPRLPTINVLRIVTKPCSVRCSRPHLSMVEGSTSFSRSEFFSSVMQMHWPKSPD